MNLLLEIRDGGPTDGWILSFNRLMRLLFNRLKVEAVSRAF